jgi:hypothetical protein
LFPNFWDLERWLDSFIVQQALVPYAGIGELLNQILNEWMGNWLNHESHHCLVQRVVPIYNLNSVTV